MKAMDEASTQAASTMRRRGGAISRSSARGHGSAVDDAAVHGSTNGCAMSARFLLPKL